MLLIWQRSAFLAAALAFALTGCSGDKTKKEAAGGVPATPKGPITSVDPATAGSVAGVVNFSGQAPSPKRLDMSQDPACNFLNQGSTFTPVEAKEGKLAGVFVYVKEGLEG